jgi:hypothetical protein
MMMHKTFRETITDIQNKSRTSLLICTSMLTAGVILLAFRHMVGWLFVCMGIALGYSLYNKNARMKKELAKISDMDRLSREYDAAEDNRFELLGLTITSEYAVMELPYFQIYCLADMAKFEVGIQENIRKALFLTDRSGQRHRIAETQKGDALQEEFDRAYETVRAYFNSREEAQG